MKRNFKYRNLECNLNDNRHGISKCNYEFFPKYKLMIGTKTSWIEECCCNTKREALEYMKRNYIYIINR